MELCATVAKDWAKVAKDEEWKNSEQIEYGQMKWIENVLTLCAEENKMEGKSTRGSENCSEWVILRRLDHPK